MIVAVLLRTSLLLLLVHRCPSWLQPQELNPSVRLQQWYYRHSCVAAKYLSSIHLSRYSNDRNLQHAASLSIVLLADFTMPNVYLVPYLVPWAWPWWRSTGTGPVVSGSAPAREARFCCLQKSVYFCSFWVYKLKNTLHWKGNNTAHGQHKCLPIFTMYNA